ncbi:MAG: hypothetical protein IJ600_07710 [Lachnospiraceae bacterium]|nr:hypothetical protein [Lachnospiraceae bacterium]
MKKDGNGVFLVVLIISVLLVIYFAVTSATKDLKEYQQMQETAAANEEQVQELGDAMQDIKSDIEAGYEDLDKQLGQ